MNPSLAAFPGLALEGERLVLRPLQVSDVGEAYARWMNDPEVNAYLESRFSYHTEDTIREFVRQVSANPQVLFMAILERDGGRHVGNIKVGPIDPYHRRGDLGLMIGERDCWGKGYAAEAIRLLTGYALGTLGLHKVTASCYEPNQGSRRAFLKAGYREEGRRFSHYQCDDGTYVDCLQFGAVAGEWS